MLVCLHMFFLRVVCTGLLVEVFAFFDIDCDRANVAAYLASGLEAGALRSSLFTPGGSELWNCSRCIQPNAATAKIS